MAGGTFGGGDGTTTAPYLVEDAADLNAVRNALSKHYKQVGHIDMTSIAAWIPIGTQASPFTGTYEGQSFEIRNFTISTTTIDYAGLFGYVTPPAVCQNIHIRNGNIAGKAGATVGGVFGYYQGTIRSCSFHGNITRGGKVGGIIGAQSGSVYSCSVIGGITGSGTVGGISGASDFGNFFDCKLSGSTVTGGTASGIACVWDTATDCLVENSTITSGSGAYGLGANRAVRSKVVNCSVLGVSFASGVAAASTGQSNDSHIIDSIIRASNGIAVGISSFSSTWYTISRCSVTNTEITGVTGAYGIVKNGHATDCYVSGGTITSTGASGLTCGIGDAQILRCYCSAPVYGKGPSVGGLHIGNQYNTTKSYFLGPYVKGVAAVTSNIGRIDSNPTAGNAANYALDTSTVILE